MSQTSRHYAGLADASYEDHPPRKEPYAIGGVEYKALEHYSNPRTGYQGTIYQRMDTGDIVVAHRGTEGNKLWEGIVKDGVFVDGAMVLKEVNPQLQDALALTQRAIQHAERGSRYYGKHSLEVIQVGHSLGGTLAQICAYRFDQRGETFNAYGAAGLGYGILEGGDRVTNHVMAADTVSAASPHFGRVRVYATAQEIAALQLMGYASDRGAMDVRAPVPAALMTLGSHSMHKFLDVDGKGHPDRSVLADPVAQQLAQLYDPMIEKFRSDLASRREAFTVASQLPNQAVAYGGRVAAQALDAAGDATRQATQWQADLANQATQAAGARVQAGVKVAGTTTARVRELAGELEAKIDEAQGELQARGTGLGAVTLRRMGDMLPDAWERRLDDQADRLTQAGQDALRRNQAEAAAARQDGQKDVATIVQGTRTVELETVRVTAQISDVQQATIGGIGHRADRGLEIAGRVVEQAARLTVPPGHIPGDDTRVNVPPHESTAPRRGPPSDHRDHDEEQARPARDDQTQAFPIEHPHYPLYAALEERLPGVAKEKIAEVTHQAVVGGVTDPGQIRAVVVHEDQVWVAGRTPGDRSNVSLSEPPPSLDASLRGIESSDRLQMQQIAQFQEQQRSASQGHALT